MSIATKAKIFISTLLACCTTAASAQTRKYTREEYIERYKHIAIAHMERYGIPASITMAQGILESANGNSTLAREANNHFGIKCHNTWKGETIYHDDDAKGECFRKYDTAEESFEDHAEFLSNHRQRRYDSLFLYDPTDYRNWARGLKAAGYATAPDYAERLIRIIEDNSLYLLDEENGDTKYTASLAGSTTTTTTPPEESVADKPHHYGAGTIDPEDYRVTVSNFHGYSVYRTNGVYYIAAQEGDTYEYLANLFRISARNLRKFNEATDGGQPQKGDAVYIERKRKRWEGAALLHTVRADEETLRDVAQAYGIRLKPLARLNKLPVDTYLSKGRSVKIR